MMISKRFRDVGLNFETRVGLIYLEEARRYRLSGQPEAGIVLAESNHFHTDRMIQTNEARLTLKAK